MSNFLKKSFETLRGRISLYEVALLGLGVLLLIVDLCNTSGAVFAGDEGKYLGWVWQRVETGLYAPFATKTSHDVNMALGGGSSLLLLFPLLLGSPLIGTALVVSALASIISLWLLFDVGRLLHSRAAGLLAVLLYLPLQNTDLRTRELIFLIPLFLLSLNLGIRLMRGGRESLYVWLAVVFGLMANTHYQGLLLMMATIAALTVAFRAAPTLRGATLLATVAAGVLFAATLVMALSRVPNWAVYALLIAILLWPRLSTIHHVVPILLGLILTGALIAAPGAVIRAVGNLLWPVTRGTLQGACLTAGALSYAWLLLSWVRQRCPRNGSIEALLAPWILVVIVVGSATLELVLSISWRHYFWWPVHTMLCLAGGVVFARTLLKVQVGDRSKRAVLICTLFLAVVSTSAAVRHRINRPNIRHEITLREAHAVLEALIEKDGYPQVRDHISRFNPNSYQMSLLYRLYGKDNNTPDRDLVVYLERFGSLSATLVQQHEWLYQKRIGRYLLIWFAEDPNLGEEPLVTLADEENSLQSLE